MMSWTCKCDWAGQIDWTTLVRRGARGPRHRGARLREGIGCCQTTRPQPEEEDDDITRRYTQSSTSSAWWSQAKLTFSFLVSLSFLTSGETKSICFYPERVR